jgi:hypothetical protein
MGGIQLDGSFEKVLSPVPSPGQPKEKEKEKEKRPRNVLRRRPSANKSANRAQSSQPQPTSPPSTSASGAHQLFIPPQGPFSPLTLSPFFLTSHEQKIVQPQHSDSEPHGLGQSFHSQHHQQLNTTFTSLPSPISASAAMPHSTTHSNGKNRAQLDHSNAIVVPQLLPHSKTAIHSSSLHPPLPYVSSRSTGGSSRGSSPVRSPIASTLGPGTPSPTKTTEALRKSPSPHVAAPSERGREWGGESQ